MAKTDKVVYSYSGLAEFKLCPRLFEAKYIERDERCKFHETPESKKGNEQHRALELCIKGDKPAPKEFHIIPGLFDIFRKKAKAEAELAMTHDEKACKFFDKNAWLRGKWDVLLPIPQVGVAFINDWKTGKPGRADMLQAKTGAALSHVVLGARKTMFNWTYINHKGQNPPPVVLDGAESLAEVADIAQRVENTTAFEPKPSWKCRYCPLTDCEFNRSEG